MPNHPPIVLSERNDFAILLNINDSQSISPNEHQTDVLTLSEKANPLNKYEVIVAGEKELVLRCGGGGNKKVQY